jgi:hypothetical protein
VATVSALKKGKSDPVISIITNFSKLFKFAITRRIFYFFLLPDVRLFMLLLTKSLQAYHGKCVLVPIL